MKKFHYHSQWVRPCRRGQFRRIDDAEGSDGRGRKSAAESEHLRGAPQDTAARTRVIRTLWEDMERERGAGKKKKIGDEKK